jgi:hypothetical protein
MPTPRRASGANARTLMSRRAAVLLQCLVIQASCGGGGTEPQNRGSYRVSITGAVTASARGPAGFVVSDPEWAVMLLPEAFTLGWDVFLRGTGPRPAAGTTIAIRSFGPNGSAPINGVIADVGRFGNDGSFDLWAATSGQIRIVTSTTSRLSGTLELSAESLVADSRGPITVTGTFDAIFMGDRPIIRPGP